ncbi:MAG: hypothetical protein PUE85_00525 [Firmicutes bacterium]|nr:hypothetical protein [Bacillota bacterium]
MQKILEKAKQMYTGAKSGAHPELHVKYNLDLDIHNTSQPDKKIVGLSSDHDGNYALIDVLLIAGGAIALCSVCSLVSSIFKK